VEAGVDDSTGYYAKDALEMGARPSELHQMKILTNSKIMI